MSRRWLGDDPKRCDLCNVVITRKHGFVDGRTVNGPWAIMCGKTQNDCHGRYGAGLGTGRGQRYEWAPERDAYVKAEG